MCDAVRVQTFNFVGYNPNSYSPLMKMRKTPKLYFMPTYRWASQATLIAALIFHDIFLPAVGPGFSECISQICTITTPSGFGFPILTEMAAAISYNSPDS